MNNNENPILRDLNEEQKKAATAIDGPVLIIAGAGTGKTKALTHRVAYLISQGVRPENILAVTFTNKAAEEMAERIYKLLRNGENDEVGENGEMNIINTFQHFHQVPLKAERFNNSNSLSTISPSEAILPTIGTFHPNNILLL